jgi:hypothetical protein
MLFLKTYGKPPPDLGGVIRPLVPFVSKPDRHRVYFNGGRTDGSVKTTEGEEVPTLEWSATARVESTTIKALGLRVLDDFNEDDREISTVRIFSEQVPEAYVDVERMDEVKLKSRSGERIFFKFRVT